MITLRRRPKEATSEANLLVRPEAERGAHAWGDGLAPMVTTDELKLSVWRLDHEASYILLDSGFAPCSETARATRSSSCGTCRYKNNSIPLSHMTVVAEAHMVLDMLRGEFGPADLAEVILGKTGVGRA